MERLRILAAALALRSFTVLELSAFSGSNENTVRSVLRRDHRFFKVIGSESRGPGPGRPERRYHTAGGKGLRAEVRTLEEALGLAGRVVLPEETDDDRLAALVVAETAALRALKAPADDRPVLLETAARCLRQSKAPEDDSEERRRRGQLLGALLDLLSPGRAIDSASPSA